MLRSHRLLWFLAPLALAAAGAGCAGDAPPPSEASGSLGLSLELAPGMEVDEVRWTISGGNMAPMTGVIDTSAPGATASVEVFGLPPGDGYLVELAAGPGDAGAICRGDALFDVDAGVTTDVMVMLNCKLPERLGGVRVNGKPNICAELHKVVVSPLQTSVGNDIDLRADAFDVEGDDIAFRWSASGGTIAQPTFSSTRYTCAIPGQHLVTIEVSDDDFDHCADSWAVSVTCVGEGAGACTTPENAAVYNDLVYVDNDGATTFGTDAAAAIGSDCVFGSANSEPPNPGCPDEAGDVLRCSIVGVCPEEVIEALSTCVESCQQDLILDITGSTLSAECSACYGESVACSAAFCATSGCSNPSSAACIECRCEEGCIPGFEVCSGIPDDSCGGGGTGGTGGGGGTGGFGGGGGAGGTGGGGGTGGFGGGGGAGGSIDPLCQPQEQTCTDGTIDPHAPCCEQAVPEQPNACQGTESLENPASCTATGNVITHRLTLMEVAGSCNIGYDLDSCDGVTCVPGGLAPFEGQNGVDNALTGLGPTVEAVGANLGGVNQSFADALCGLTDDPESGVCGPESANEGQPCTSDDDCIDGACNFDDNDCLLEIPVSLSINFGVDANYEESCATVTIQSVGNCSSGGFAACTSDADCAPEDTCLGGGRSQVLLNLGEPIEDNVACASGTLGTVPITIAGIPGTLGNSVIRMTVSEDGFSDGLLGSTVDQAFAVTIAEALLEGGGAIVSQVLDIGEDLNQDTSTACDAISTALVVGGAAMPAPD